MDRYKKSKYVVSQYVGKDVYLCSNFNSGKHILMSEGKYRLYRDDPHSLETEFPEVFARLQEGRFIIEEPVNEYMEISNNLKNDILDENLYHVIVNPTLDCNLNCWYCYENKVHGSKMSEQIVCAVSKHIACHYNDHPYGILKLSFFGGEPFLHQDVIESLVSFAKQFCARENVKLVLDFTTNGTLLTNTMLDKIEDVPCMFQITLDGHKERHNKIKFSKDAPDAFSMTINNIYRIQKRIKRSVISVRINFDKSTLRGFDQILSELSELDRYRTKIILKKVWQVDSTDISKDEILRVVDQTLAAGFVVDCYSQGGVCFADRNNQVTFNYDGSVFKCTTVSSFDSFNSLGELNLHTGAVVWDMPIIDYLSNYEIPTGCTNCPLLPSCGGPCRKKLSSWKNEDCFLNHIGLSIEEYALVQFKTELVKQNLYENKHVK